MKKEFIFGFLVATFQITTYAAIQIDLKHQPVSLLKSFTQPSQITFKEVIREQDKNQTTHTRVQQLYAGYPVIGGDFVIHSPKNGKAFMNGIIYQNLNQDLPPPPPIQSEKIINHMTKIFNHKTGNNKSLKDPKAELMVYVDTHLKPHWVYRVNFFISNDVPHKPTFIIDAFSLSIYKEWDSISALLVTTPYAKHPSKNEETFNNNNTTTTTNNSVPVMANGYGGNQKIGRYVLPFAITRDENRQICELKNDDVLVKNYVKNEIMWFSCITPDPNHGGIWWNGEFDKINGAYSPPNDALAAAQLVKEMYLKWYGIPPIMDKNGKAMLLEMHIHYSNSDNMYYMYPNILLIGDGWHQLYSLVSLQTAAWGFSNGLAQRYPLDYFFNEQAASIYTAFSLMAGITADFFKSEKINWQFGADITKKAGEALYYMDVPSKDCEGRNPGYYCSIDKATQYNDEIDYHWSSGVYRRAFYLIASANGWNIKKAFDVMVQAYRYYWTYGITFSDASCGVLNAAKDLGFEDTAIKQAFDLTAVDYHHC